MPENEFVIQTENLTYRYEGADRDAVKGVSLSVRRGEFLAVLGRNGSGKSTLGKLLNALIAPTEGSVCVCGIRPDTEDNTFLIRQKCGMVFQNPDNQTVATIVEEDVAFGPENLGVAPEEIRARVDWALEKVGMTAFRRTAPSMLSGGQKQRVAIAGVIAMKPEIIVFDESTSMLDPAGRLEVMETAKALNRENGVTVVWITHFMDEAAQASRLIVVDDGEIRLDGAPRQVFSRVKEIQSYGLEAPDMTVLAAMLRERGLNVSGEILTVEEMEVELCRLRSSI
ncbi:MAG: energy-coupling factor transporter ATPase [Eubacteriales bacterium]|nr:energy-coupling factor transporter ATPase [Clostridia bacterium]MDY2768517.1 energy-coupling factor transporter ATPase [Eubacteriales bacterium]